MVSSIPMAFWEELNRTATKDWPSVVRKYGLDKDSTKLKEAADRIKKEKESQDSWAMSACSRFTKNYVKVE